MKKIIFGLNLILILGLVCFAQKQKTDPNEEVTPRDSDTQQNNKQRSKQKNAKDDDNLLLQSGASLEAQLQKTLDVRNAKIGDQVVLTVTKNIKQDGEVVVQKGSRLIGHVTEVQQKTKSSAESKLGVVFDRIEGQNLSAPISATIVSITEARAASTVGDTLGSDISGSSRSSGTVSGRGSGSGSGAGLLGGVTNTVGGVLNTTTSTVGGVTGTANQTLGGATQTVGTTLSGIQISQSSSASAQGSTVLSAENKNLRLEKGATFLLRVNQSVEN